MDYFYEVAMLDMIDADLIVNFSIMLTLMSVATGLYYEIETIIRFMSKTTGRSGFLITRNVSFYQTICFHFTHVRPFFKPDRYEKHI